jgi:Flp pilus assembly pilin Flp
MGNLNKAVKRLWQEEQFVEYGLLLILLSLAVIAHMFSLASAISNAFGTATSNLSSS